MTCRCGHVAYYHSRGTGRCQTWASLPTFDADGFRNGPLCSCQRFDDSRLPGEGERLEFGVHHMATADSEAEAWPIGERAIRVRIRKAAGLRG